MFSVLCAIGLSGCHTQVILDESVRATHGCVATFLSRDVKKLSSVYYEPFDNKEAPAGLLPKEFHTAYAYHTPHGYIITAEKGKSAVRFVWVCNSAWRRLRPIRNLPQNGVATRRVVWDPIQHRVALIDSSRSRSEQTGMIDSGNTEQIGIIDEASARYIPVRSIKQQKVFSADWVQGKLVLVTYDATNNLRIILLDTKTKSTETFYQEPPNYAKYPSLDFVFVSPDQSKLAFHRLNPYPDRGSGIWIVDIKAKKCFQVTFGTKAHYWHNVLGWISNDQLEFIVCEGQHSPFYTLNCAKMTPN